MEFNEDLSAIHSYLCADGYVIKNPETQKQKYYQIGFRNTNLTLLRDFQERFYNYFRIKPRLYPGQRCILGNKGIYNNLIKNFESFYSYEWKMPNLDEELIKIWLRAYFDCEGWVFCKRHQNRTIGADCVNLKGLTQVKDALEKLGIISRIKKRKTRNIYSLYIYGKENLIKFRDKVGFLHPDKSAKLDLSILDYVNYNWEIRQDIKSLKKIMLKKAAIKRPYLIRVVSIKKQNLDNLSIVLYRIFKLEGNSIKIYERFNGLGNRYYELIINKKSEVRKLIDNKLINNEQFKKINIELLRR